MLFFSSSAAAVRSFGLTGRPKILLAQTILCCSYQKDTIEIVTERKMRSCGFPGIFKSANLKA